MVNSKYMAFVCALLIVVLIITVICSSETLQASENFKARTYTASDGHSLNYRVYMPTGLDVEQQETDKKYPLVLFFHGAGERGEDNYRQLKHGARDILAYSSENDQQAIIIAPQCPLTEQWVDIPWNSDAHTMPEDPSLSMRLTIELMQQVMLNQSVDENRVYVTGMSMGGFATWDILQRVPSVFAAAIPICGGGDINHAKNIKDIPIWAFHGDKDEIIKPKRSRDMITAIKQAEGQPNYTEYKNINHDSWTQTYANKNVLEWFFQQQKRVIEAN